MAARPILGCEKVVPFPSERGPTGRSGGMGSKCKWLVPTSPRLRGTRVSNVIPAKAGISAGLQRRVTPPKGGAQAERSEDLPRREFFIVKQ